MFAPTKRLHVVGALLTLATSAAVAADAGDRPADYAQRIPLTVSGKQAIVQLPLPRAVYLASRAADLRDLRVFDAAGNPMPYALTTQVEEGPQRRTTAPAAVFPVHAPATDTGRLQDRLQIRTGEDGAVISVTAPAPRHGGSDEVLAALVLDMRPAGQPANARRAPQVAALSLTLPPGVSNYSAELVLETSDDLERWEELAQASVSWLVNSQGAQVRKDRITFAPRAFRYARLRWLDGKPIAFAAVNAEYVEQAGTPRRRDSLLLQAKQTRQTESGDLVYTAPVAIPVEAVGLQFGAQNVVLPALIGQYQTVRKSHGGDLATQFRPLVNTTFYQMTQNGQQRASGDVDVPLTHATQWVVRPQSRVAQAPQLRLGWTGATMVFLAGGEKPYSIAVGRDGVPSVQVPLSQVAPGFSPQELAALEKAQAGEPVIQHAQSGATPGDAPKKAVWLWALLVGGVAALAAMAWRLSRQLKETPPGAESR